MVALPRFNASSTVYEACLIHDPPQDVRAGTFGIREPGPHCPVISLNQLEFSLIPGVAFDLQGRRLGRGKGYYDRLLASSTGTRCGVGFDERIVSEVPTETHDVSVHCILTPSRWIVAARTVLE
jgi:5-formyltetrahydrofolate cyclo-ligase